jgi:hypothetical protein
MRTKTRNTDLQRFDRLGNAVAAALVALAGGCLALNGLLLAVAPSPPGLLATAAAAVTFAVTVLVS